MRFLYVPVLKNNLSVFQCVDYGDVWHLKAYPHLDCWGTAHTGMFVFAIVWLVVYSIGVPLLFTAIMFHGRRNKRLSDGAYIAHFGFIYMPFEVGTYANCYSAVLQKTPPLQTQHCTLLCAHAQTS